MNFAPSMQCCSASRGKQPIHFMPGAAETGQQPPRFSIVEAILSLQHGR
jgi:hypothetical protein